MNLISQHPAELILDVGNDLFDDVVDVFILEGAANILEGEVKGDRFIARFNLFARIDIEDADVYEEGTAFFADFGFKVACGDNPLLQRRRYHGKRSGIAGRVRTVESVQHS